MDGYFLVVWFMVGSEMEVVRTENLTRAECIAKLEEVLTTRRTAPCRACRYQPPIWWHGRIL